MFKMVIKKYWHASYLPNDPWFSVLFVEFPTRCVFEFSKKEMQSVLLAALSCFALVKHNVCGITSVSSAAAEPLEGLLFFINIKSTT